MGAGASSKKYVTDICSSSEEELRTGFQRLAEIDRSKILTAIHGDRAAPKLADASPPPAVTQAGLEALCGRWCAIRLQEWGINPVPIEKRRGTYVLDCDSDGNFNFHHCPSVMGYHFCATDIPGFFEGDGHVNGMPVKVTLTLLADAECKMDITIGSIRTVLYLERLQQSERLSTEEGALQLAAEAGDMEKTEQILTKAPNKQALLAAKDTAGSTVLHTAAYHGQLKAFQYLLRVAPDPEALLLSVNNYGSTPLHVAAFLGDREMCSTILESTKDFKHLMNLTNSVSKTAMQWAKGSSTAHLLHTYRPWARMQWPSADCVHEDSDHLTLGITTQAAAEGLEAIDIEHYVRDEAKLSFVTKAYGKVCTGYDVCACLKAKFKKVPGYGRFSILEVMTSCDHAGTGRADVFLSHAQKEPMHVTLNAMQQYELRRRMPIKFFVDIFSLRQCVMDFVLDNVKGAICAIGRTVMIAEPWNDPFTVSRTFCVFEIFVTLDGKVPFEVVAPADEEARMLTNLKDDSSGTALDCVQVHMEIAGARSKEDKDMIDNFIIDGPGFELSNNLTTQAVRVALLVQAHQGEAEGQLSIEMIGKELANMGQEEAIRVAGMAGAHGWNMVHRCIGSITWIRKFGELFGGGMQALLMAEDHTGLNSLNLLVSRNAEEEIYCLLVAAEDPEAMLLQPIGTANPTFLGWPPLIFAVSKGSLGAIRALLASASSPQQLLLHTAPTGTSRGNSALTIGGKLGTLAVCELLLATAEDPQALLHQANTTSEELGMTAFIGAAQYGHVKVCELFLKTVEDKQKMLTQICIHPKPGIMESVTALHFAAAQGSKELAQVLLNFSPDPTTLLKAIDVKGQTPAAFAKLKCHHELALWLEEQLEACT